MSDLTKDIDQEVEVVRDYNRIRVEYMSMYAHDTDVRNEGREEGRREGEEERAALKKEIEELRAEIEKLKKAAGE